MLLQDSFELTLFKSFEYQNQYSDFQSNSEKNIPITTAALCVFILLYQARVAYLPSGIVIVAADL